MAAKIEVQTCRCEGCVYSPNSVEDTLNAIKTSSETGRWKDADRLVLTVTRDVTSDDVCLLLTTMDKHPNKITTLDLSRRVLSLLEITCVVQLLSTSTTLTYLRVNVDPSETTCFMAVIRSAAQSSTLRVLKFANKRPYAHAGLFDFAYELCTTKCSNGLSVHKLKLSSEPKETNVVSEIVRRQILRQIANVATAHTITITGVYFDKHIDRALYAYLSSTPRILSIDIKNCVLSPTTHKYIARGLTRCVGIDVIEIVDCTLRGTSQKKITRLFSELVRINKHISSCAKWSLISLAHNDFPQLRTMAMHGIELYD